MIRNRFRLTSAQRETLRNSSAFNQRAERIFLIGQNLQELTLLLLSKRLQIVEIKRRILVYGSSACLQQALREQQEQVEDLTQLVEDRFNVLGFLLEKPALRLEPLTPSAVPGSALRGYKL
jgi:transcriptional regulator of heat shock response